MTPVSQLLSDVTIGESKRHGRLDVFPLFMPRSSRLSFDLLDDALAAKTAEVSETSDAGSVPVLKLLSRGDQAILLLDGEELVGAKQNRILNTSVLASPGRETLLPVSCVEQGRWRYETATFSAAKHALFAKARARKAERMAELHERRKVAGGGALHAVAYAFDADQSSVWADVSDKLARMQVASASAAISDGYSRFAGNLDEFEKAFTVEPGQRGAIFALDGRVVGLELLATDRAFRTIFPKLLRSYAFDAIEASEAAPAATPTSDDAKAFIAKVLGASLNASPGVGLGTDFRLDGRDCAGHALVHEDEVVHLAAFARELAN